MTQCSSGVVESWLHQYGWAFRTMGENRWCTGWEGEERYYPLYLSLSDTWMTFRIQPFIKLNIDWESWPEISAFLLELGDRTRMVRPAIDEDGNIVMTLEVFTKNLDYDQFSNALGVLGYYADGLFDQILAFFDQIGFRYAGALNFLT